MTVFPRWLRHLQQLAGMLLTLLVDALRCVGLCLCPPAALAAENLFLRKQLALYCERDVKPRRATQATRLALNWLAHRFNWRQALTVVQPETFIRWHQRGFRCYSRATLASTNSNGSSVSGATSWLSQLWSG
jgi:hypothetical protein